MPKTQVYSAQLHDMMPAWINLHACFAHLFTLQKQQAKEQNDAPAALHDPMDLNDNAQGLDKAQGDDEEQVDNEEQQKQEQEALNENEQLKAVVDRPLAVGNNEAGAVNDQAQDGKVAVGGAKRYGLLNKMVRGANHSEN